MDVLKVTKGLRLSAAAIVMAGMAASAHANGIIVLDFEGLGNLEPVDSFYDGGLGGFGSGPGPDFNLTFSSNSLAIIDSDAGGSGNFGGEPSPDTILFFETGTAVLNVPDGFDTGFSFFYSAVSQPGVVTVYDGLNATGNVLATLNLPVTPSDGGDPNGNFSPFFPIGVAFTGTAFSIDFGGTVNQIGFDDVTFGSETPGGVPEPVGLATLGVGLFGLGAAMRRRRRS